MNLTLSYLRDYEAMKLRQTITNIVGVVGVFSILGLIGWMLQKRRRVEKKKVKPKQV